MKISDLRRNLNDDLHNVHKDFIDMNNHANFESNYGESKYPADDCLYDFLMDANYNNYDDDPLWNQLFKAENNIDNNTLDKFKIEPFDITSDGISRIYKKKLLNIKPDPIVTMKVVRPFAKSVCHQFKTLTNPHKFSDIIYDAEGI